MANNYITQFDETLAQQEVPNRKITVVDTTIQHSVQQFRNQQNGGIQENICYSPANLDIVRWKLGRCWNDNAGSRSEQAGQWEWDPANSIGSITQPETLSSGEKKEVVKIIQDQDKSYGLDSNFSWQWSINSDLVSEESYTGITSEGEIVASAFGSSNPNNATGKVFFDHVTDLHATIDYNNINNRTFGSVKALYHSVNPSYNFYVEDYEDALNDFGMNGQGIDERTIPNMYAFLMVQQEKDPQDVIVKGDPSTINDIYELHVTLNKKIEDELYTIDTKGVPLANTVLMDSNEITKGSEGQYFDKYANSYLDFQSSGQTFENTKNRFSNIIVPSSDLEFYNKFDSKKNNFPMYVGIEFSTDTNAQLADALVDSRMSALFIKDTINRDAFVASTPSSINRIPNDIRGIFVYRSPDNRDFFTSPDTQTIEAPPNQISLARSNEIIGFAQSNAKGAIPQTSDGSFFFGDKVEINGNAAPLGEVDRIFAYRDSNGDVVFYENIANNQNIQSYDSSTARLGRINRWIAESNRIRTQQSLSEISSASFSIIDSANQGSVPNPQPLNIWDISEWFDGLCSDTFQVGNDENFVFLGPSNEEISVSNNDPSYEFYRTIMVTALKGRYEKLLQEKVRTYGQALSGDKAYSETVFYEIEKWLVDTNGNLAQQQPVQSIYLPNSSEIDVHKYVDTQVKYGQKYLYRVKSYQAIFGTQYRYDLNSITPSPTPSDSNSSNGRSAEICVFTKPSVKLVEVPYFEKTVQIVDSPPIFPDIDVIPYKDERNKVLFFMRGNVGDYDMQPVSIEFDDNLKIANVRESQERPEPLPINFKSDDQARTFEVFRLEEKPSSYLDFLDNKIASLDTSYTDGLEDFPATSTSFVDNIESNKKYYYVFRTIDVHENISNPTPVYEIEIIDNEGAPALVTEVYQITRGKLVPQSFTKTGKRYIHIRPSEQQLIINEEAAGLLNEDGTKKSEIPANLKTQETAGYLGISDDVIWNKDYKIRLTSKKTGKQIDFNIKYVTKVNRPTS